MQSPRSTATGKPDLSGVWTDAAKLADSAFPVQVAAHSHNTATLDEILDKAKAPQHIDYLSIDVEGAELEVLRGFSLGKYEVDALTIEHNNEPQKRDAMWQLLASKGYTRVRSWVVDDWYVRKALANRYEFNLEFGFRK